MHGQGQQAFLTTEFEEERKKGLLDRDKLTSNERTTYEITGADGGGRTDPETYEIKQFPFPADTSIRPRKTIDVRKVRPELGEMSD